MGGWDPASYNPVIDVFVYNFTTRRWRCGNDIAGGHDENKNVLKSAGVYDLRTDEWAELTQMSQERDECEEVVIGWWFFLSWWWWWMIVLCWCFYFLFLCGCFYYYFNKLFVLF